MFKVNKSLNLHMLQVIFWKYAKMQSLVLEILRLFFKKQKGKFITMVKYLINYWLFLFPICLKLFLNIVVSLFFLNCWAKNIYICKNLVQKSCYEK